MKDEQDSRKAGRPPQGNRAAAPGDGTPQGDAAQDLRATAGQIRVDIGRLAALEDEKLTLEPDDPRVDQVSDEAVALADRIRRETRVERQLSEELG
jgi:hypothetical protein